MGANFNYLKGSHNPFNFLRSLHFDSKFYQENPFYFHPWGIIVFCGPQSSGKTLSAIKAVKKIAADYPNALICSNLPIVGIDRDIIPFTDYSQLTSLENGTNGIIFLIDEIHVLWNSLESKNIPISEMAIFAQMRKQRRLIIGTSQVYGRIAKPIREQLRYCVKCRNILKYIQINTCIDPNGETAKGETSDLQIDGEEVFKTWFIHSPSDYQAYDTLTQIKRLKRGEKK